MSDDQNIPDALSQAASDANTTSHWGDVRQEAVPRYIQAAVIANGVALAVAGAWTQPNVPPLERYEVIALIGSAWESAFLRYLDERELD